MGGGRTHAAHGTYHSSRCAVLAARQRTLCAPRGVASSTRAVRHLLGLLGGRRAPIQRRALLLPEEVQPRRVGRASTGLWWPWWASQGPARPAHDLQQGARVVVVGARGNEKARRCGQRGGKALRATRR